MSALLRTSPGVFGAEARSATSRRIPARVGVVRRPGRPVGGGLPHTRRRAQGGCRKVGEGRRALGRGWAGGRAGRFLAGRVAGRSSPGQPGHSAGSSNPPPARHPSWSSQVCGHATACTRPPGRSRACLTRSLAERRHPANPRPEDAGSSRTTPSRDLRLMCRLELSSTYRSAFLTWVGVRSTTW